MRAFAGSRLPEQVAQFVVGECREHGSRPTPRLEGKSKADSSIVQERTHKGRTRCQSSCCIERIAKLPDEPAVGELVAIRRRRRCGEELWAAQSGNIAAAPTQATVNLVAGSLLEQVNRTRVGDSTCRENLNSPRRRLDQRRD